MNRPYIICHMLMSIDGKVTGEFLSSKNASKGIEEYYRINRGFKADAFACGRVTMNESFVHDNYVDISSFEEEKLKDYVHDYKNKYFAISFDRYGKLFWKNSIIVDEDEGYNGAHIIEVVTERVNKKFLSYLKSKGISYIIAGKDDIDILLAAQKLHSLFEIDTMLLEGGSIINGAFEKAGIIDELSLIIVPLISNKIDKSLFYDSNIDCYDLLDVKKLDNSLIYSRYKRRK